MISGVPTVIMPLAHDQFEHAARAHALGVSETIKIKGLSEERLAEALAKMSTEEARGAAAEIAGVLRAEGDAAQIAAGLLVELAGNGGE